MRLWFFTSYFHSDFVGGSWKSVWKNSGLYWLSVALLLICVFPLIVAGTSLDSWPSPLVGLNQLFTLNTARSPVFMLRISTWGEEDSHIEWLMMYVMYAFVVFKQPVEDEVEERVDQNKEIETGMFTRIIVDFFCWWLPHNVFDSCMPVVCIDQ